MPLPGSNTVRSFYSHLPPALFYSVLAFNAPRYYPTPTTHSQKIFNYALPIFVSLSCGTLLGRATNQFILGYMLGFWWPDTIDSLIKRIKLVWNSSILVQFALVVTQSYLKMNYTVPAGIMVISGVLGRYCSLSRREQKNKKQQQQEALKQLMQKIKEAAEAIQMALNLRTQIKTLTVQTTSTKTSAESCSTTSSNHLISDAILDKIQPQISIILAQFPEETSRKMSQ